MRFAIVVFPGSNCDQDCYHVAKNLLGCEADYVWHHEKDLKGADAVILPGGFAYGDYLRAGALARFSPVMESVREVRARGRAGARHLQRLPGAAGGRAPARRDARQPRPALRLPRRLPEGRERRDAVHPAVRAGRGRPDADRPHGRQLHGVAGGPRRSSRAEGRVVFRYCDAEGRVTDEANPNGADDGIAGVVNEGGNVVGLMPHPDRCAEGLLGNDAGRKMFESVVVRARRPVTAKRAAGDPRASAPTITEELIREHNLSDRRSTSGSGRSSAASRTSSSSASSPRCGASTAPTSPRAFT